MLGSLKGITMNYLFIKQHLFNIYHSVATRSGASDKIYLTSIPLATRSDASPHDVSNKCLLKEFIHELW